MKFNHQPVLLEEVVQYLNPQPNENFIDCTLGGGGHSKAILEKTGPNGKLLGVDLDPEAIKAAQGNLREFNKRMILVNDNYQNLQQILYDTDFNQIDGILLDLGLSSYQIQSKTRGFSFKGDSVLDMRFGKTGQTAADILNHYRQERLVDIFKKYGEERYSKEIAREIVKERKINSINQTAQLVAIIENVYKKKPKPKNINVATKVFQALRIEVNGELENIKRVLPVSLNVLRSGGRLAVISFHSLEDRIVKNFFRQESRDCLCSPEIPVCSCGHKAQLKILTKKVVIPGDKEIRDNPRARSAKLRVAIKI